MTGFFFCIEAPDYNEPFNEKWPSRPTFDPGGSSMPLPLLPPLRPLEYMESGIAQDIDKSFWAIWVEAFIDTYKGVVSITACHFIQNSDERDSLEIKIARRLGKGLFEITIELGKYSKKILFSSEPILEKAKRIGAVVASLLCIHFAVNTLSNRQKTS